jgi:hypothetical protein
MFELVGDIFEVEVIVVGRAIRERARLRKRYGGTHWRKLKGVAKVRLPNGSTCPAEVHWYEAHGIGRVELKISAY